jgi:hypothetical protein
MNIIEKKVKDLKPYEKNPRLNEDAVKYVAESIKEFGFKVPIVIDKDNNIVCGHTRWKACKKLKIDTVPCVVADDLTEEQIRAYRLADNKVGEKAEWDFDLLESELDELSIDMTKFGFDALAEEMQEQTEKYTSKVNIPQYEPTGEDVALWECYDTTKADQLIDEIENAPFLSDEQRKFLRLSAYRHVVFNYRKIAEYYAKIDGGVQTLMENSALVIIDYENAVANGYVKLSERLKELCHAV